MSKSRVNSAIILGTRQWDLKASCNRAAVWPWCCLIQGVWEALAVAVPLSFRSCVHPEPFSLGPCLSYVASMPMLTTYPADLDQDADLQPTGFRPPSRLWICLAIPGQLADRGYCSAPLLSGYFGAVPLSVRPLPCLPCRHPWLPVCLLLQSRKLSVLPDANFCITF